MVGYPSSWKEDRLNELRTLYFDLQWSGSRCAKHFNTTRGAVMGAAHRLRRKLGILPMSSNRAKSVPSKAVPAPVRPKPVTKPVAKAKVLVPVVEPEPLLGSILERKPWMCAYPYGISDFKFCGRTKTYGAYCQYHGNICYQPPLTRKRH